ncbi:MAG: hypothetical protein Q9182_004188 [Xanthomendoza sp. 2 TL-2023]
MPVSHINPSTATAGRNPIPALAPVFVDTTVACGPGHNEAVYEIGDGLSTRDARNGGKDDGHIEFNAAENVGAYDGASDVHRVYFKDEEDAGERDDRNTSAHFNNWYAENDDVGDQVCDSGSQPASPGADAVPNSWRPRCTHWRTCGEVVSDGTDQESTDSGESDDLDQNCVFTASPRDENAAVEDDEGELKEAEGSGPGELFDE